MLPGVLLHVVLPSEGLSAPAAGELLLLLLLRRGLLTFLGRNKVIKMVPLQSNWKKKIIPEMAIPDSITYDSIQNRSKHASYCLYN